MGNESIDSLRMGFMFVFFAAVLSIVIFNTQLGKQIFTSVASDAIDATYLAEQETFEKLFGDGKNMPTAAAYAFIGYNDSSIHTVTCYVEDSTNPTVTNGINDTCLVNHLSGFVNVKATYNNEYAQYDLTITPSLDPMTGNIP